MSEIQNNIASIRKVMEENAIIANRQVDGVSLIAVSKVQSDARIEAALDAGQRVFGENKVQEATSHWAERRNDYADLRLHLIGPLQTNKVKQAVELFDVIETLDRPKLADALGKEMKKQGRSLDIFIQVNTGEEEQKSGVLPCDLQDLFAYACDVCGLNVVGLMCLPPAGEPAGLHFGFLKTLADRLGLAQVSMGMSGDYDKAIRYGATHIRVGSALFGAREYS